MAIYACGKCRFCFERKGAVEECPNCGHTFIKEATEDEIQKYRRTLAEFGKENGRDEAL